MWSYSLVPLAWKVIWYDDKSLTPKCKDAEIDICLHDLYAPIYKFKRLIYTFGP